MTSSRADLPGARLASAGTFSSTRTAAVAKDIAKHMAASTVWKHSSSPQMSHQKRHSFLEGRVRDTST